MHASPVLAGDKIYVVTRKSRLEDNAPGENGYAEGDTNEPTDPGDVLAEWISVPLVVADLVPLLLVERTSVNRQDSHAQNGKANQILTRYALQHFNTPACFRLTACSNTMGTGAYVTLAHTESG